MAEPTEAAWALGVFCCCTEESDEPRKAALLAGLADADVAELVHMARLSPPDRRSTLILLTPDGDGVWYGPGAPLGLRLTDGYRVRVDIIGICAPRYIGAPYASS